MKQNLRLSFILLIVLQVQVIAQSVVNTAHNLSVSGPGTIRATSESEVCIFCHTPHSSSAISPLWNRDDPGVVYSLYNSPSSEAVPLQPGAPSLLCLSCHDGTIALGSVLSRTTDIDLAGGVTIMPATSSNLSTDLSDDHPVSFLFNTSLASADGQLFDPSLITPPVKLRAGNVECTSCHDPHNNSLGQFLVVSNQFSELCYKCHDRTYWPASSHKNSVATWNGSGTDPWFHTGYTTVAENGCENCHNPHGAEGRDGIRNYIAEENNCLVCHNGNVSLKNIESDLAKPYRHNVYGYNLSHVTTEPALVSTMHVECEDCHNPHAVESSPGIVPAASGALTGVIGITSGGATADPLTNQYELCFRCHAGSPGSPAGPTTRLIEQNNTMLEFDPANPSYHPVVTTGQNPDCPSLIAPAWDESSVIYCTACHASDSPGAEGPHGSNWPHILKLRYETADYTTESPENYALCYSCHSRASILGDNSFGEHYLHIVDEMTPCNACHDPHGISYLQGTGTNNTHLINFDTDIVISGGAGIIQFVDTGTHSGYCLLRCHGKGHGFGMSY